MLRLPLVERMRQKDYFALEYLRMDSRDLLGSEDSTSTTALK
jgi:hypothetical protein